MASEGKSDIEVFTGAIQLQGEERIEFLDKVCGKDVDLHRRIEALLRFYEQAGNFLETPPTVSITESRAKVTAGEKRGDRIDRYFLLEQIGEGGCGVVFLAEQKEPVRRRVALKVIKPGMDTRSVIARFDAERQALALMDHPNIAHVFDAGTTASGRPYFVMELVRGLKITEYCDQLLLSTEQRLDLFIQVCGAVQHAHQKGIIHRDIKPSNILIMTSPEGKPIPKVIDFGIAKATTGLRLTDKTLFTNFEMLIGTPAYMSPEQAELTSIDVDTRSDIYSLGVLLYELLTGMTPFDTQELLKAGVDEMRRVIRTKDPVRPSTRLSTMAVSELLTVAERHHVEPPRLIREVRGDLDWIVIKAMEKDRNRRYVTANGLAVDIGRYLHKEAIVARPPSALYRLRKLIQRNRPVFIGLALIFLLLVAALGVALKLVKVQQRAVHESDALRWESKATGFSWERKPEDAEAALLKSVEIRRRYLGSDPPTLSATRLVGDSLVDQRKLSAANELLNRIITTSSFTAEQYFEFNRYQVEMCARYGGWQFAGVAAKRLLERQPDDHYAYHALAPLYVLATNLGAYHQLCLKIVSTFSNTTDMFVADRMAKDCLMLPSTGVDLNAVAAMAKLALTKGKGTGFMDFFVFDEALAQYRLGNYQEAIYWAQVPPQREWIHPRADNLAILAMAQFKLGKVETARHAMTKCNEYIASKLPGGELAGPDWRDWILARSLQSEAKQLIDGQPSSPEPASRLPR